VGSEPGRYLFPSPPGGAKGIIAGIVQLDRSLPFLAEGFIERLTVFNQLVQLPIKRYHSSTSTGAYRWKNAEVRRRQRCDAAQHGRRQIELYRTDGIMHDEAAISISRSSKPKPAL
jgi:hypothetical protein